MAKPDKPEEASGSSVTPATEGGGKKGGLVFAGRATNIVLSPGDVVHFVGGRGAHVVICSPAATPPNP